MSAADALAKVRRAEVPARNLRLLPVTDDERRLKGAVDLPTLVTAAPTTLIADLLPTDRYSVRVDTDQEVAARLMQEADAIALPVVDTEDRLVGIITVDDAMEILEARRPRTSPAPVVPSP
jgi:magnesium transporter